LPAARKLASAHQPRLIVFRRLPAHRLPAARPAHRYAQSRAVGRDLL